MVKFVIFVTTTKTLQAYVVCAKEELSDRLKEYRRMGRSVSLPEKLCKVEWCQEFGWSCVRCIKKFYQKKDFDIPSSLLNTTEEAQE